MAMETTTITAIVTCEHGVYPVVFNSVWANSIGSVSDDCWYAVTTFEDLDEARAYADRLVRLADIDEYTREAIHPQTRISTGNYQGCGNAPIVHRVACVHEGDPFAPWSA